MDGTHKEPNIKLRENERLRSFTRFTSDEWAIMRPDIYNTIQQDGRSKETMRDILQEAFTVIMDASPVLWLPPTVIGGQSDKQMSHAPWCT